MKYTVVVVAVVIALFCRAFLVSVYKVPTQTMAPAILAGDFILASQVAYGFRTPWSPESYLIAAPEAGDLVVFSKDYKTYIKRVAALAQDEFYYRDGELWINSVKCGYRALDAAAALTASLEGAERLLGRFEEKCGEVMRTVIKPVSSASVADPGPAVKIPSGKILVVSDNRNGEQDSEAELIAADQIIGKPLFIWMSYASTQDFISGSLGIRWNRILTKVQ